MSSSSSPKSILASLDRRLPLKKPERRFFFAASASVPSAFLRRKTFRLELLFFASGLGSSGRDSGFLARRPGLGERSRRSAWYCCSASLASTVCVASSSGTPSFVMSTRIFCRLWGRGGA